MTYATQTRSSLIRRFTLKRGSAIFVWAVLVAGLMLPSQSTEAGIEGLKAPIFSSPATFFTKAFRRNKVSRTPELAGPQAQDVVGSKISSEVTTKAIAPYWPGKRGFLEPPVKKVLGVGEVIDRYGREDGAFASPRGTPFEMRSLPSSYKASKPLHAYEVIKPFEVDSGKVAPAFGHLGQGVQYELPKSVSELIDSGYLKRVDK